MKYQIAIISNDSEWNDVLEDVVKNNKFFGYVMPSWVRKKNEYLDNLFYDNDYSDIIYYNHNAFYSEYFNGNKIINSTEPIGFIIGRNKLEHNRLKEYGNINIIIFDERKEK